MSSIQLYKERIIDHYRNPRHQGTIPNPDAAGRSFNALCGDALSFDIQIKDGMIDDIKFQGTGCILSQATASLVAEYFHGKKFKDIANFTQETLSKLVGIDLGPTRSHCIFLSHQALQKALCSTMLNF